MMYRGKSMGGGGGGGGGSLLRSVGRAVTRANFAGGALQEPNISSSTSPSRTTSHSSPPRHVSKAGSNNNGNGNGNGNGNLSLLSPPPFASRNVPVSSVYGVDTWHLCDGVDWVSVDDEYLLDPAPSEDEVHTAVSALQQVFGSESCYNIVRDKFGCELDNIDEEHQVKNPPNSANQISPVGSEIDWIEPSLCMCDAKLLQCGGSERVFDAFRLLRTEPLVQKMVKSLSSDAAVWSAVLNNEVVRELRETFSAEGGVNNSRDESDEDSGEEMSAVRWIFDGTRAKFLEVVEKITKLVSNLFQFPEDEKTTATSEAGLGGTGSFGEKVRTSFMLSIMVLLVVVVARAHKA